jgi:hypothetical protein
VQFDGKTQDAEDVAKSVAKGTTLAILRDGFVKARKLGREKSTQYTTEIHFKHLAATLGEEFPLTELRQTDLQRHVERRAKRGISATTIKKEVTTLRTALKGKHSTRRAPLTQVVIGALKEWLAIHPGGRVLFCHAGEVAHSKKRSRTTGHQNGKERRTTMKGRMETVRKRREIPGPAALTVGESYDHFKRTLAGSKWEMVRGLHTLRHSVASCLAAAGVDQRNIDDMLGHVSLEMQRRYRSARIDQRVTESEMGSSSILEAKQPHGDSGDDRLDRLAVVNIEPLPPRDLEPA